MSENSLYRIINKEVDRRTNLHTYTFCRLNRYDEKVDATDRRGICKVSYDGDLMDCSQGDYIKYLDNAFKLNVSVDINELDNNVRAYAGKSLDIGQSVTDMCNSMQAMRDYMGLTSGEVYFSDVARRKSQEALDKLTSTVDRQEMSIKATAEAITTLTTKVPNGPPPYNHSGMWKAMSVDNASHMQLPTGSANIHHTHIKIIDGNNVVSVMDAFDSATGIKKCYYDSPCPTFYHFLGKVFCVWDEGRTPIVQIFRILYGLTERNAFNHYCRSFGLETHYDPKTGEASVFRQTFGRKTAMCIHPVPKILRCEDDYHNIIANSEFSKVLEGKSKETQADRIAKRMRERTSVRSGYGLFVDLSKGYKYEFDEENLPEPNEEETVKDYGDRLSKTRSDRIPPSITKERTIDDSMAKAMKAKRDGRFDIRVCSDGTVVRVGELKPQLTMGEEIEQRLIEKYLT